MRIIEQKIEPSTTTDIPSLVRFSENLRSYSDKVKFYNHKKKKIEKYLNSLKEFHEKLLAQVRKKGIDVNRLKKHDNKLIKGLIKKNRHKHKRIYICNGLCSLNRVPPRGMNSIDEIEALIQYLDYQLAIVGESSQLAEIDLQNAMQQGQQMLQMMSKVSKSIHEAAMAVVRSIK